MPKQHIYPRRLGDSSGPLPEVTVGWSREAPDVQINVAPPERVVDIEPECPTKIGTIADAIRADLEFVDKHRGPENSRWHEGTNYRQELETALLVYERGWWADLDRAGINRLILTLRKARDAAFGKDA